MKTRLLITMLLVIILIISTSNTALAKVNIPDPDILPNYLATSSIRTSFVIDSAGNSVSLIDLRTKSTYSTVDLVKATVYLIDDRTNTVIKTWSNVTMDGPTPLRLFTFEEKYKISQSGTYYIKGTLKLYDGTTLVETVTCESSTYSF